MQGRVCSGGRLLEPLPPRRVAVNGADAVVQAAVARALDQLPAHARQVAPGVHLCLEGRQVDRAGDADVEARHGARGDNVVLDVGGVAGAQHLQGR